MNSSEDVLFKDHPKWLWLMAAIAFGVGMVKPGTEWRERLVLWSVSVALVGFASILTVAVDRGEGVLHLRYRSFFRRRTLAFRFEQIREVRVVEDRDGEGMYRVELVLNSGHVVPLRAGYSVARGPKERRAQRLREAIGLGRSG